MRQNEQAMDALMDGMTPADREWFARVTLYMRLAGWVRDTAAIGAQLAAMAQDLRDAERAGLDAPTYFGQGPRQMAQAILAQLPLIGWRTRGRAFLVLAGASWLLLLLAAAGTGSVMQLSVFKLGVLLGCLALGEVGVIRSFAASAYSRSLWWPLVGVTAATGLAGGVAGATLRWAPDWLRVTVPAPWDYLLIGLSVGALVLVGNRVFHVALRRLVDPNVLLIGLLIGAAVLKRYWLNTGTEMTQIQAWWILALFGGGTLGYIGWQLWTVRRVRRLARHQ